MSVTAGHSGNTICGFTLSFHRCGLASPLSTFRQERRARRSLRAWPATWSAQRRAGKAGQPCGSSPHLNPRILASLHSGTPQHKAAQSRNAYEVVPCAHGARLREHTGLSEGGDLLVVVRRVEPSWPRLTQPMERPLALQQALLRPCGVHTYTYTRTRTRTRTRTHVHVRACARHAASHSRFHVGSFARRASGRGTGGGLDSAGGHARGGHGRGGTRAALRCVVRWRRARMAQMWANGDSARARGGPTVAVKVRHVLCDEVVVGEIDRHVASKRLQHRLAVLLVRQPVDAARLGHAPRDGRRPINFRRGRVAGVVFDDAGTRPGERSRARAGDGGRGRRGWQGQRRG